MSQPQRSAKATTAALRKIDEGGIDRGSDRSWQATAYQMVDLIGEVGYALNLKAWVLSKGELKPEEWDATERRWVDTTDERVHRTMAAFIGPQGGQAELLRRGALHLAIGGESYLVGTPADLYDAVETGIWWEFLSTEELIIEGPKRVFRKLDGADREQLPSEAYIARMWRAHPKLSFQADSELRRVLDLMQEVVILSQYVGAVAKSRLSAGILFVPEEMSFAAEDSEDTDTNVSENGDGIDEFEEELIEHMSAPVQDRTSAAGLVPLIMRGPAEFAEAVRLIDVARELDTFAKELREEALSRLARSMDIPPEVVEGRAGTNHWCKPEDTEVLVRGRGWSRHGDLRVGDIALTLNHETGAAEWQPVLDIYRAEVVDEPMLSMESLAHSSLSTRAHRWPVVKSGKRGVRRDWTTSEAGFGRTDAVPVAARCANLQAEPKWTDDFVRLAAAYTSDGTVLHYESGTQYIRIVKFQDREITELRRVLGSVFGVGAWREETHPTRTATGVAFVLNAERSKSLFDVTGEHKALTLAFIDSLTQGQLDVLFTAMIELGDGVVDASSAPTFYQVESSRLDPLEYAAVLAGYKVTRGVRNQQTGFGERPLSWLRLTKKRQTFSPFTCERKWESYTGTVWCPTTANGTWFARHNGKVFVTGNSAYLVDVDFINRHVTPPGDLLAEFSTFSYLRPMLEEYEGMPAEESVRYRLVYDGSAIAPRQDEANTHRLLFTMSPDLVSGEALRAANGVDEAAKPDEEEVTARFSRELILAKPDQFYKLLNKIPGFEDVNVEDYAPAAPAAGGAVGAGEEGVVKKNGVTSIPVPSLAGAPPAIESGQDEPAREGQQPGFSALVLQLSTAADAAVGRALERAGARVINLAKRNPELKDRLRAVDSAKALTLVRPTELQSLGLTPKSLLNGAWDNLALQGRRWIGNELRAAGVDSLLADDRAALAASQLCSALDAWMVKNLHDQFSLLPNGLRVPEQLVVGPLNGLVFNAVS